MGPKGSGFVSLEVAIVAAEASSAKIAEKLILEFRKQGRNDHFFGVGTEQLSRLGVECVARAEDISVVGLFEVIKNWTPIKKSFEKVLSEILKRKPQLVILFDFPDFNLRLAQKLNDSGVPVLYYVSPQVWAWRKSRVKLIKKYCKKILVIFPFEKKFYDEAQVDCEYVGHPILEDVNQNLYNQTFVNLEKSKRGLSTHSQNKVLLLFPGSRKGEIERNFPTQLAVAENILKKDQNVSVIVGVAPTIEKEDLAQYLSDVRFPFMLLKEDPFLMVALSDAVLVTSGTATLTVGLLRKPMVIMYRFHWLTGILAKILVRGVKFFGLPNLILGKEVAPERMQSEASVEKLTPLVSQALYDGEGQKQELENLLTLLGDGKATEKAFQSVKKFLREKEQ